MTAGKGIARSYLAQLAEPVPAGEPVFTARRGAPARAGELAVEAPIVEDVIESREGRSSQPSRVVRRKVAPASAHAVHGTDVVQRNDAAVAGIGGQKVRAAIQAREVVQAAAGTVHINRVAPLQEVADVRNAEPTDSNAERRYERIRGAEKATKPLVEDVVSDTQNDKTETVLHESSIKPVMNARHRISPTADKAEVRVEQVFRPVMQGSVRAAEEPRVAEARTTAADEPSRNTGTPPREFVAAAGGKKAGVSVRIGTIEVRTTTPPPQLVQAATQAPNDAQSKPADSHFGPRPTSRDSLSSGLAWNYGLIQG